MINRTGIQQQQLRNGSQHQNPLVPNGEKNEPSKVSVVEQSQNLQQVQVGTRKSKNDKLHIQRISRATSPFDISRTRARNTNTNASTKVPVLVDTFTSKYRENDDCNLIKNSSSNRNNAIKTSSKICAAVRESQTTTIVKPFVASLISENILDVLLNELVLEFSAVIGDLQRGLVDTF